MKPTYYVVEALRWGDRENHSYVVGVYDTMKLALVAKATEEAWRGGKYHCDITKISINDVNDEKAEWYESTKHTTDTEDRNLTR